MNDTVITLIPSTPFRPISLCNVFNTKIIANRLRPMMCKLVGEAQCGFIPGRQAADNIILAQEALHPMRKKKGWMDKEKAYDRVSWKLLEQVLRQVGFQQQLIDLIMFCVTSAKLSVTPQRGLRQGDPFWVRELEEGRWKR